jgi:hypothetical protein
MSQVPGEKTKPLTRNSRGVHYNRSIDEDVEMVMGRWIRPYFRNSRSYPFHRAQRLGLVVGIGPIFATKYLVLHRIKVYIDLRM